MFDVLMISCLHCFEFL